MRLLLHEMREGAEHVTNTSEDHRLDVKSTDQGFQATCSCGWKGVDRCRMSDDYAWTNACNEAAKHKRNLMLRKVS